MSTDLIIKIAVIIVAVLLVFFYILWQLKKNGLRKTVIDLIVEAERTLEDNQEKFEQVVNGVLIKLPFPFNLIPTVYVRKFIQKVFDEIKISLDYKEV